ncbi:MAG: hypothetical protein P8M80_07970 [Pirellulaceae bacterium]|nr:hypothetical protein [Pirellulaceae bacterium]
MNKPESKDWTWDKATSLKLTFWPDFFIVLLLLLINGSIFKACDNFLPDEWDFLGFVIAFPFIIFFGRIWLNSIESRNKSPTDPADVEDQ